MARKILIGECGCATLSPRELVVTLLINDSNRVLLVGEHYTLSIYFDSVPFAINELFSPSTNILSYLNTTFVAVHGLVGIFTLVGGAIRYSNEENFLIAEIMSIFIPKTLVFSIGAPPQVPNVAYTALANTNVITDVRINGAITAIRLANTNIEPLDINGWSQSVDFKTITFNAPDLSIYDSNVYIEFTQTT